MPKLLDLFCGAGGAAMGYYRAGFDEIVGIDIKPQKRYPFNFIQADALEYVAERGSAFDAIHASPPCQFYSQCRYLPWVNGEYWESILPTREALIKTGLPYVIENVENAKRYMVCPFILCGYSFGLPIYRHRCFETSGFGLLSPGHLKHSMVIAPGRASIGKRHHGAIKRMGIDWMTGVELAQAIPPAYTEFIGKELLKYI